MTVHLVERKGVFHAVISYKDERGKWCQKSKTTNLKATKSNERKADKIKKEFLEQFEKEYNNRNFNIEANVLFSDFLYLWLETKKMNVRANTLYAYTLNVDKHIAPYFKERNIKLCDLNQRDLQAFLNKKIEEVGPNTVLKFHQHIYSALKYALRLDLIQYNAAERVELPRKQKFCTSFYTAKELQRLLEVTKGTPIESAVYLTAHYGFRREEVLGLKYSAIDFDNNTILVEHTVVLVGAVPLYLDGTKTVESKRTLPLMKSVKKYLLELKESQRKDKEIFGTSYFDSDYICRWNDGKLIKPTYVSQTFNKLLKKNDLRHIRFHDLRHSAGSLMLRAGCDLKDIQAWLGHSNIATTGDIYAHLIFESKVESSNKLEAKLQLAE